MTAVAAFVLRFLGANGWRAATLLLSGALTAALLWQTVRLLDTRGDLAGARTDLAELKTDHAEQRQRAAAAALHSYTRMQGVKDAAIQAAEERNAQLARDAGTAHAAADGMRRDLAEVPTRIAAATAAAAHEAVAEYAAAVSVVFDQCVRQYQGMAEVAAGHASDVRTLSEAWPVNEPVR